MANEESEQYDRYPQVSEAVILEDVFESDVVCDTVAPNLRAEVARDGHRGTGKDQSFRRTVDGSKEECVGMVSLPS